MSFTLVGVFVLLVLYGVGFLTTLAVEEDLKVRVFSVVLAVLSFVGAIAVLMAAIDVVK